MGLSMVFRMSDTCPYGSRVAGPRACADTHICSVGKRKSSGNERLDDIEWTDKEC